jgi:hypothetical protein
VSDDPDNLGGTAPAPPARAPEPADPVLAALWKRALEAWDDEKTHQALLDHALREQKLPDLAGLYRGVKDSDPERAPRAKKKLDAIVIAATHMLMAMKTPVEKAKVPLSMTLTAAAVTFLLLGWLTYAVFHR